MNTIDSITLTAELMQLITPEQAWHYRIIPQDSTSNQLLFYCDETTNSTVSNELELLFGKEIKLFPVSKDIIQKALGKYYRKQESTSSQLNINESSDFLRQLIFEAKEIGSSDIHLEVYEERCRIRLRIDGKLLERYVIEAKDYPSMINKIKIMSGLDIAEKRLPQDGRIFFKERNQKFDIRVSILPTLHGEKIVMRLLSNDATNIDIEQLGFGKNELTHYKEGIKKPNGILLISGPTGSGKTTTLYATLKLLNDASRNVVTIEDPIEYTLEGINQVQLRENIGLNFPSALSTFLRQDPDVIMVGEIRDKETANMAIRASLTGHLVLSTIHTNSAWGTVSRLEDMGVPSYLISNTLNTSVAQRLVRKLCTHCKEETTDMEDIFPINFKPYKHTTLHYKAVGCDKCFHTGYKGRVAVYEIIPINQEVSEEIRKGTTNIQVLLKDMGINSLSENAFDLFSRGITSAEEIYPLLMNQ